MNNSNEYLECELFKVLHTPMIGWFGIDVKSPWNGLPLLIDTSATATILA